MDAHSHIVQSIAKAAGAGQGERNLPNLFARAAAATMAKARLKALLKRRQARQQAGSGKATVRGRH